MPRPRLARSLIAAALLIAALLAAAAPAAARTTKVTVMTRNLYLGADLIPLATTDPGAPFQQAAGTIFAGVGATDPDARMRLVAREIAKARPDLVGLQEVSLWRTGPQGDPAPATTVAFDYLAVIRAELARLRASYRVVADQRHLNVEGPSDRGVDIRLTLGNVVLARGGVKVSHAHSADFSNQLTIPTRAVGPVQTTRGWNALDATVRGARLHFVNTHPEAYSAEVRLKQARELVRGPLRSRRTVVLVGDLNSGPKLPKPEDRPPYLAIARAGLVEARTSKFSCCVDDLHSGAWDHNVDHIMTRPKVRLVRSYLTGREKTASGQFPSDHGGVVSVLALPR